MFGCRVNQEPANSGECLDFAPNACTIVSYIHPTDPNRDPHSGRPSRRRDDQVPDRESDVSRCGSGLPRPSRSVFGPCGRGYNPLVKREEPARQMEHDADRMEHDSGKIGEHIEEAREDWEAKERDPTVPGAQPDRAEEEESIPGVEVDEDEVKEQPGP